MTYKKNYFLRKKIMSNNNIELLQDRLNIQEQINEQYRNKINEYIEANLSLYNKNVELSDKIKELFDQISNCKITESNILNSISELKRLNDATIRENDDLKHKLSKTKSKLQILRNSTDELAIRKAQAILSTAETYNNTTNFTNKVNMFTMSPFRNIELGKITEDGQSSPQINYDGLLEQSLEQPSPTKRTKLC